MTIIDTVISKLVVVPKLFDIISQVLRQKHSAGTWVYGTFFVEVGLQNDGLLSFTGITFNENDIIVLDPSSFSPNITTNCDDQENQCEVVIHGTMRVS